MTDNRRMTTDRFYGGVSNRLQNLRSMLEYVGETNPSRSQLNGWVISNTRADSEEAVSHHLTFLESIELIELSETSCDLAKYGEQWLNDQNPKTLYEALSSGVKGFNTILQALQEDPMSDEDIMDLLVSEFEEAEMTKPGPAIRHREWLQVLGFINRKDGVNEITRRGLYLLQKKQREGKEEKHILDEPPSSGETFVAKVDRISSSGNGIVATESGHINIGPVTEDSVGEIIRGKMLDGLYARCETGDYRTESYQSELRKLYSRVSIDSGDVVTVGSVEFCDKCGSMMRGKNELWVCQSCGMKKKKKSRLANLADEITEPSQKEETESAEGSDVSTDFDQGQSEETSTEDVAIDMEELREKAEKNAVEKVSEAASTTTEKPQYNRSSEVKEYVKARADGECEGCGEPAPFTSKTGEPYLHAHHIHELSDGGSDTPDTVVALCPNCHYRIHHGENGEEYNQELLNNLQKLESEKS